MLTQAMGGGKTRNCSPLACWRATRSYAARSWLEAFPPEQSIPGNKRVGPASLSQ